MRASDVLRAPGQGALWRPCGASEQGWVAGQGVALARRCWSGYTALAGKVYVEVRGTVSGAFVFGRLGAYARQLRVSEVKTVGGLPPAG